MYSPQLYHSLESTGGIDAFHDSGKDFSFCNISVVQENIFASKLELYESDLYDVIFSTSTLLFTYCWIIASLIGEWATIERYYIYLTNFLN